MRSSSGDKPTDQGKDVTSP